MSRSWRHTDGSSSSSPRWRWDGPTILLAIVVVASPMAIGGVHAITAGIVASVALVGLWWSLTTSGESSQKTASFALSIPALGCAAMALLCLVQLIPVPTAVVRLVQPAGYEAIATNWEVVYDQSLPSGWHLLSLDPGRTAEHGLRWIALAATAALAAQVIRGRSGRRRWLGILLISATVVAVAGAAQYISGTDDILGIYEAEITARSIAPFVNTNHAASYFGMMAVVAVGFSLDHLRRSPPKTILGAFAATAAIGLCSAHGSDGAVLALAVGIAVVAVAIVTRVTPQKNRHKNRRYYALVGMGLILAAAIASFAVPDDWTVAEEDSVLDETSAEVRLHMAKSAVEAFADHPVVGSGAGSVERVLPAYLDWHYLGARTVPTIENEPVEWLMTMGPLAALLVVAIAGLLIKRLIPHVYKKRGRRGAVVAGALTVYFAIVAMFHFPFATLGLAVVFLVALEACLHRKRDRLHRIGSRRTLAWFALALTVALLGLLAARATILSEGPEEHYDVADEQNVRQALILYPTDGALMSAKSLDARADGNHRRALDLAERAFELRPHPQQQFLLAGSLAGVQRHEQAAEVYRSLFDENRRHYRQMYRWAEPRLLYDLPNPELRALAFADSSRTLWRRFLDDLEDEQGMMAAIEVALQLVELLPDDAKAHLELIERYRDAEQDELAEMYARTLVARNLEDDQGRRPAGLLTLIDILRDRDRHSPQALNLADRAFASGHTFQELAHEVLGLMPRDIDDVDDAHHRVFDAAVDIGCVAPYDESYRELCWSGHAYLAEVDGDIERAENYYRRIERNEDDPRWLAAFYARHQRCRDLAVLQREYGDTGFSSFVDRQATACARRSE